MYKPKEYWETRGKTYIYESHEGDEERGQWIEDMVNELKPTSVLEIGCGPGKYFSRHRSVPLRVAIDFSSSALATIPNRQGCHLVNLDACSIGFVGRFFDLSFTCAVLVHIPYTQISRAIEEICRVTKNYVLIMEYFDPEMVIKELASHCFRHDYIKEFEAQGFSLSRHRRLSALIGLFLFERT